MCKPFSCVVLVKTKLHIFIAQITQMSLTTFDKSFDSIKVTVFSIICDMNQETYIQVCIVTLFIFAITCGAIFNLKYGVIHIKHGHLSR